MGNYPDISNKSLEPKSFIKESPAMHPDEMTSGWYCNCGYKLGKIPSSNSLVYTKCRNCGEKHSSLEINR